MNYMEQHIKKNTTTNTYSVAKQTYTDPIINQINLYHKWLDRHRYILEKFSNKNEWLNKLNEECKNNNNIINNILNLTNNIPIDVIMDHPSTPNNDMTFIDMYSKNNNVLDEIENNIEKRYENNIYDNFSDDPTKTKKKKTNNIIRLSINPNLKDTHNISVSNIWNI